MLLRKQTAIGVSMIVSHALIVVTLTHRSCTSDA